MRFSTLWLVSALLISFAAGAPADLEARKGVHASGEKSDPAELPAPAPKADPADQPPPAAKAGNAEKSSPSGKSSPSKNPSPSKDPSPSKKPSPSTQSPPPARPTTSAQSSKSAPPSKSAQSSKSEQSSASVQSSTSAKSSKSAGSSSSAKSSTSAGSSSSAKSSTSAGSSNSAQSSSSAPSSTAPAPSATSGSTRNKCSAKSASDLSGSGSNKAKRSIGSLNHNSLDKRTFARISNPDQFTQGLLKKKGTQNLNPDAPTGGHQENTYLFQNLNDNKQYQSALMQLAGCTALFVVGKNGVFSSHIFEENTLSTPRLDLQPENYEATVKDLQTRLTQYKDVLSGGQAFLIVPTVPGGGNQYLYGADVVKGLTDAIQTATGITVNPITTYVPLDADKDDQKLETTKAGTASFEFDPEYVNGNGQMSRAYRVISEGNILALHENL